ncbi:hypothetical protein [Arenimonas aestuarii]
MIPPRRLLQLSRRAFTPVALAFLLFAAWTARDAFLQALSLARAGPVLLAILAWSGTHLLVPLMVHALLAALGRSPGYRATLRIHFERLPARYLPGGIWHTVSRIADLSTMGFGRRTLAALVALENLLPLGLALLLAGLAWFADDKNPQVAGWLLAGGAATLLLLPLLASRLAGHAVVMRAYAAALLPATAFWLIAAFAFTTYWLAFPTASEGQAMLEIASAYLLAWASGFVAVFAPQGMGVFEAVAASLLRGALPFAGVAVLVAGFRATLLAGDALAYLLYLALRRPAARNSDH